MAGKRKKLSSLQGAKPMVPAAVWFENNSSLPSEVPTAGKRKKKAQPDKLNEPVPAAIWFENYDTLPSNTDLSQQPPAAVRPVVSAPNVKEKQQEVDNSPKKEETNEHTKEEREEVKRSLEAHDDIEALITSILNLTKSIEKDRLDRIRGEEIDKDADKKKYKSFKDLVKSISGEKVGELKGKLSLRSALVTAGLRSAFRGSDSILDKLLQYREDKKIENAQKPSIAGAVLSGTSEYLKNKIVNAVDPIREKLSDKIVKPVVNSSIIKKISEKSSTILNSKVFSPVKNLTLAAKTAAISKPNTLFGTIARNYYPEINNDKELMVSRMLTQPNTPADKKFTAAVRGEMRDELVKLSEDQLDQLKKIVNALSDTPEEKLEKRDKEPAPISETKKVEDKKDSKSLIETLLSGFSGIKNVLSSRLNFLSKTLGPLLKFAAPALGVAAAGATGVAIGTAFNNKVISPMMERATGVQGATLGTAIYDAVDNVQGWFGESDKDKLDRMSNKREVTGKIKDATQVKATTPYRVSQTQQVKSKISEPKTVEKPKPSVVDARTNIVNNSTSVSYIRPKVRNEDNTFNTLLSKNFNH